jgi:hypothetical protein
MEQLPLIDLPDIVTIQAANNHLKRSGDRPYTLRFTVCQGPKFTGKRISISLGTKDIKLAEMVAAITLESLKKGGFIVSDVKFNQPTDDHNSLALRDLILSIINEIGENDVTDMLRDAIKATS